MQLYYIKLIPQPVEGVSALDVRNQIFKAVHAFIRARGRVLALALCENFGLTVFAKNADVLEAFYADFGKTVVFRDYCRPSLLKEIVLSSNSQLTAYQRFNLPGKTSFDNVDPELGISLRERRKEKAKKDRLEYLLVRTSSGRQFSYYLERKSGVEPGFNPNGYGFSNPSEPFGLPVV